MQYHVYYTGTGIKVYDVLWCLFYVHLAAWVHNIIVDLFIVLNAYKVIKIHQILLLYTIAST